MGAWFSRLAPERAAVRRYPHLERWSDWARIGLLASVIELVLDLGRRSDFGQRGIVIHAAVAFLALVALCVPVALGVGLVVEAARALGGVAERRDAPRLAATSRAIVIALAAGLVVVPTAFFVFRGKAAQGELIGRVGPWIVIGAASLAATVVFALHRSAARAFERGRVWWAFAIAVVFLIGGAAAAWLDATYYVALYARLHTVLEVAAIAGLTSTAAILLRWRWHDRAPRWRWALSLVACAWLVLFASRDGIRAWHARILRHVGRDPVIAGRVLRRLRSVEALMRPKPAASGEAAQQLAWLKDRYDVDGASLHPRWRRSPHVSARGQAVAQKAREGLENANIVVYFVDTLRDDVAHDATTMPRLTKFQRESLDFKNAYSTGSDTLRALPGLVSGRYDAKRNPRRGTLFDLAHEAGVRTKLFIPESSFKFLGRELPMFKFDDVTRVRDYPEDAKVWGYGADQPTAARLVDEFDAWLGKRNDERFVAWLYNFDLHNWRELQKEHIDHEAKRLNVPTDGPWNWQYRVVASSIDSQFGRMLDVLRRRHLHENTVIVFVSDHGEGLGYQGFWVHSVFLWESLIRVPLVVHVPGMDPKAVEPLVSLVDVTPTVGRFLRTKKPMPDYHGADLLALAAGPDALAKRPILTLASSENHLSQFGLVDGRRKLVLPLEFGEPELYALEGDEPDARDIAPEDNQVALRLLNELLRSPLVVDDLTRGSTLASTVAP